MENLEDIFDNLDPQDPPTPDPDLTPDPDPTPDPEPTPDPAPTPDPTTDDAPLIQYLTEAGVISLPDDYQFKTDDKLSEAVRVSKTATLEQAKEELLSALPEEFKPLLEYGLHGGTSLQEYLEAFATKDIDDFDITDTLDQKQIISLYYKEGSKFSDEKINRLIARYEAAGALQEAAEEAIEDLKTLREEKRNTLVEKQKEVQRLEQERMNTEVIRFKEAIDNYESTPGRKLEIQKLFFTDHTKPSKYNELLESIRSNYSHLLQFADLLLDYDKEKGFNFSRFKTQGKASASKGLREVLEAHMQNSKTQVRGSSYAPKDDFDWEKFISI